MARMFETSPALLRVSSGSSLVPMLCLGTRCRSSGFGYRNGKRELADRVPKPEHGNEPRLENEPGLENEPDLGNEPGFRVQISSHNLCDRVTDVTLRLESLFEVTALRSER